MMNTDEKQSLLDRIQALEGERDEANRQRGLLADRALAEAQARQAVEARALALEGALRPFAAFIDALEQLGGNTPKTGTWHAVESSVAGYREITVEDFKLARALLPQQKEAEA